MIPVMDDPLGKYWDQPCDIRSAPMDETHVLLTEQQFRDLHEYSATLPSGVYPGKCWKRKEQSWLLVWFGIAADPTSCTIEHRLILIV